MSQKIKAQLVRINGIIYNFVSSDNGWKLIPKDDQIVTMPFDTGIGTIHVPFIFKDGQFNPKDTRDDPVTKVVIYRDKRTSTVENNGIIFDLIPKDNGWQVIPKDGQTFLVAFGKDDKDHAAINTLFVIKDHKFVPKADKIVMRDGTTYNIVAKDDGWQLVPKIKESIVKLFALEAQDTNFATNEVKATAAVQDLDKSLKNIAQRFPEMVNQWKIKALSDNHMFSADANYNLIFTNLINNPEFKDKMAPELRQIYNNMRPQDREICDKASYLGQAKALLKDNNYTQFFSMLDARKLRKEGISPVIGELFVAIDTKLAIANSYLQRADYGAAFAHATAGQLEIYDRIPHGNEKFTERRGYIWEPQEVTRLALPDNNASKVIVELGTYRPDKGQLSLKDLNALATNLNLQHADTATLINFKLAHPEVGAQFVQMGYVATTGRKLAYGIPGGILVAGGTVLTATGIGNLGPSEGALTAGSALLAAGGIIGGVAASTFGDALIHNSVTGDWPTTKEWLIDAAFNAGTAGLGVAGKVATVAATTAKTAEISRIAKIGLSAAKYVGTSARYAYATQSIANAVSLYATGDYLNPGTRAIIIGSTLAMPSFGGNVSKTFGSIAVNMAKGAVFNEGVGNAISLVTTGKLIQDPKVHALLIGSGAFAGASPSIAVWGNSVGTAGKIFASATSHAGLWGETYLLTGMASDALQGNGPSFARLGWNYNYQDKRLELGHYTQGLIYGGLFGGVFSGASAIANSHKSS